MSRGIQGGKDAGIELLTSRVLLAGVATAAAGGIKSGPVLDGRGRRLHRRPGFPGPPWQ